MVGRVSIGESAERGPEGAGNDAKKPEADFAPVGLGGRRPGRAAEEVSEAAEREAEENPPDEEHRVDGEPLGPPRVVGRPERAADAD